MAATMAAAWPSGKLDANAFEVWLTALADLEGGHVALALTELAKTSKFQPSIAEIRAETARQEVASRPVALPAPEDPANPFITFLEWRAMGYPGVEEYGLTAADADRITRGATWVSVKGMPS